MSYDEKALYVSVLIIIIIIIIITLKQILLQRHFPQHVRVKVKVKGGRRFIRNQGQKSRNLIASGWQKRAPEGEG